MGVRKGLGVWSGVGSGGPGARGNRGATEAAGWKTAENSNHLG